MTRSRQSNEMWDDFFSEKFATCIMQLIAKNGGNHMCKYAQITVLCSTTKLQSNCMITGNSSVFGKRTKTQCGNLRIFLPFRFYVKSIFANLRRSKTAIFDIFEGFEFRNFGNCWCFQMWNFQKSKFRASKMTKIEVFELPKLPIQIGFYGKSE